MKEFSIDLQSFIVEARNKDEARRKAIRMLEKGEVAPAGSETQVCQPRIRRPYTP